MNSAGSGDARLPKLSAYLLHARRIHLEQMWILAVPLWWTAYALVFASQVVAMGKPNGDTVDWDVALRFSFGGWMTWVPLTYGLYWVVKRHPLKRDRALLAVVVQSTAVGAAVLVKALYIYATNPLFDWYVSLPTFSEVFIASIRNNLMLSWAVIGICHAVVYSENSRHREKKMADMEKGLATAQLDLLKAQMNPHFLFNALNSVAEMVHKNADLADEMLVSLSELLRDGMRSNGPHQRSLREEIELVNHYLLVEQIRLGSRLQMRWDIDDVCADAMVPALVLQPLVENAIVHGISRRRQPGHLSVRARRLHSTLVVRVENSLGPDQGHPRGNGMALRSTKDRLRMLHGVKASLSHGRVEPDRYVVEFVVPLERANEVVRG